MIFPPKVIHLQSNKIQNRSGVWVSQILCKLTMWLLNNVGVWPSLTFHHGLDPSYVSLMFYGTFLIN